MTMRRSNWPAKLALFIAEKKSQPFDWEHNNCAFFACDWLAMSTGVDPAADYRDRVNSAFSAAYVLREAGGIEAIASAACERWNWQETAPALAQRGDIVTTDTEHSSALGVCVGARAVFAGVDGLEFKPMAECRRAWRIE